MYSKVPYDIKLNFLTISLYCRYRSTTYGNTVHRGYINKKVFDHIETRRDRRDTYNRAMGEYSNHG